jgi:hypothetical protein
LLCRCESCLGFVPAIDFRFGVANIIFVYRFADSILAFSRFNGNFDFVVTGSLDREQDASIGFVSNQPKKLRLLVVLLDQGQSAISNGAGGAHGYASRRVSCRSGPM